MRAYSPALAGFVHEAFSFVAVVSCAWDGSGPGGDSEARDKVHYLLGGCGYLFVRHICVEHFWFLDELLYG